jgi:hypothetical protein
MHRSLAELRDRVEVLINKHGEDASVAAFIFTYEDVFTIDKETFDESPLPKDRAEDVLHAVGDCDYIYEQIGEIIDDEVRRVSNPNEDIIRI